MAIQFITGNKNKLAELKAIISEVEQLEIDLTEVQDIDPHEIIKAKLREALKHHSGPLVVEDTSLTVSSMNGLPGPFIKWFLKSLGVDGIWKMVSAFDNTKAQAKAIIGYAENSDNIQFFEGILEGQIVEPRGDARFGWDPIFQPEGSDKTFAEMTQEEKNAISHRKIAATKLKEFLNS